MSAHDSVSHAREAARLLTFKTASPPPPHAASQAPGSLADLLRDSAAVAPADLARAQAHAQRQQMPLVDAIVALGVMSEADAYGALARALNLQLVDPSATAPTPLALRLVPARVARQHGILPLAEDDRDLTYATSRPLDVDVERDVAFASGRRARPLLACPSQLAAAIDRAYAYAGNLEGLCDRIRKERPAVEKAVPVAPAASSVSALCGQLVECAVAQSASDIHIEPTGDGAVVRYRVGGILEAVLSIPAAVLGPLTNRFKVMAQADITIRHRPQDGAFCMPLGDRGIDVRLSTLPTLHGEKLVMRVIDRSAGLQQLDELGYDADTLDRLRGALARPDGFILVTGPTGSGKTTVLYAALSHLRTGQTNIVTVEDPVERHVKGITQIPVNPRAGTTFASALRSVLRQDPNVVMVGEIRDPEVAEIMGQAAYTGHLVLSSLHTTDTASAITRLMNLGLEPFRIAESLTAIVAQRLVRRICSHCAPAEIGYAGPGCDRCNHAGYSGRAAVAEILVPTDDMRSAIAGGASAQDIRAALRASGSLTLAEAGLALVQRGVTTYDEVNRVIGTEGARPALKPAGRRRVLVADDDRMVRHIAKTLLEREGFEVRECEDGRQAVALARESAPDLLLIDLTMPVMDGYQAIAAIRAQPSLADLPIVVLTARDEPGVEERVLELGADDYMTKPLVPNVILSRVRAVFRRLERRTA
jgi:type IV pilus assembly protein PilB